MNKVSFQVMSKADAIKFTKTPHDYSSIIISINNSFEYNRKFIRRSDNGVKAILYLYFDDVDASNIEEKINITFKDNDGNIYIPISKDDAVKIVDFVERYKDQVDNIIIHCYAGVSRSAGVCAAIMKALIGNDNIIWGNNRYVPNMMCYSFVLEEFANRGYFDI